MWTIVWISEIYFTNNSNDGEEMEKQFLHTLQKNEYADAYISLNCLKRKSDLGLDQRSCCWSRGDYHCRTIKVIPQEFYDNGLSVVICCNQDVIRQTRLDPRY